MSKKIRFIIFAMVLIALSLIVTACREIIDPSLDTIYIKSETFKTEFLVGEDVPTNSVLVGKYDNNDTFEITITPQMIQGFDSSKPQNITITITYEGLNTTYNIAIREAYIDLTTSIEFAVINKGDAPLQDALDGTQLKNLSVRTSDTPLDAIDMQALKNSDIINLDLSSAEIVDNTLIASALSYNSTIENIILPHSLTHINADALAYMDSLEYVVIGENLISITGNPFKASLNLNAIYAPFENTSFMSINGVLYNKTATLIIAYPVGKEAESFIINSSVATIGRHAFYQAVNLTSLDIPSNITMIDNYAFYGCSGLTAITFQEGVNTIGSYAFAECSSIADILLSDSVSALGEGAFYGCASLSGISLSRNIATIKSKALGNCVSLSSITIGGSVKIIEQGAFNGSSSLSNIEVDVRNTNYSHIQGVLYSKDGTELVYYPEGRRPESGLYTISESALTIKMGAFYNTSLETIALGSNVQTIENQAFINNPHLISFTMSNQLYFKEVGGVLYDFNQTRLIKYPDNKSGVSYTLPNSVTNIAPYALSGASKLNSITLGLELEQIASYALSDMVNLESVILGFNTTIIQENAFSGSPNVDTITFNNNYITISPNALDTNGADITLIAPPSPSASEFYGWYSESSEGVGVLDLVLDESLPVKLNNSVIGDSNISLHARYADYMQSMTVKLKENRHANYYITTTSTENSELMSKVADDHYMEILLLNGSIITLNINNQLSSMPLTTVVEDNYIITVNHQHLTATSSIRLKEREQFNIIYRVANAFNEGGYLSFTDALGATSTPSLPYSKNIQEGRDDISYMRAISNANYSFSHYTVEKGENDSDYFIDLSYILNGNDITLTNINSDIIVTAYFLPIINATIFSENIISPLSTDRSGGNIVYNNATMPQAGQVSVMMGASTSAIIAIPHLLYPQSYVYNEDDIYGYRFLNWLFFKDSNPLSVESLGDNNYRIGYTSQDITLYNYYTITNATENNEITSSSVVFTELNYHIEIYAQFIPYYELTYIAHEGGTLSKVIESGSGSTEIGGFTTIKQYITHGQNAMRINATTEDCYDFDKWSDNRAELFRIDAYIIAPATYEASFISLIPLEYLEVSTASDFNNIRNNLTANYILTNDIDLSGINWVPIGTTAESFSGMVDGRGYTISNFNITNYNYMGIFGYFTGEVRNLNIDNVTIKINSLGNNNEIYAGGLIGFMGNGSVSVCSLSNINIEITSTSSIQINAGGIVGNLSGGVISNSYIEGRLNVHGNRIYTGGICGLLTEGEIFNNISLNEIWNGYNTQDSAIGAIIGRMDVKTVYNNFYDKTIIANQAPQSQKVAPTKAVGYGGLTSLNNNGLTTAQLQSGNSLNSNYNSLVWNFTLGSYPTLNYEVEEILIESIADLGMLIYYPSGNYKLMNDLVLNSPWTPIPYFSGTFDGNTYSISGVEIKGNYKYAGFFARVGSGAVIKNFVLKNMYMEITGGSTNAGGMAGLQTGGIIFASYVNGTIYASNTSNIHIGGITGIMTGSAIINNSYALMNISSINGVSGDIGGLAGTIQGSARGVNIKNSYSSSALYASGYSGIYNLSGLVGSNKSLNVNISNNFYISDSFEAIDENYDIPNAAIRGITQGLNVGDIAHNYSLKYEQISAAAPMDNWNLNLWTFMNGLNPNLYYQKEGDYFNPISGTGSQLDPFMISTGQDLAWLKVYNTRYFALSNDIDLNAVSWEPFVFAGGLDGRYYSIKNLNLTSLRQGGAGLFSELNGMVQNLNIINADININSVNDNITIGILAISLKNRARVVNTAVTGNINAQSINGNVTVGGIAGRAASIHANYLTYNGSMCNINLAAINGIAVAGGLYGSVSALTVANSESYSVINVSAREAYVGGVVGTSENSVIITRVDSISSIFISGRLNSVVSAGGLVGQVKQGAININNSSVNKAQIKLTNLITTLNNPEDNLIVLKVGGMIGALNLMDAYYTLTSLYGDIAIDLTGYIKPNPSNIGMFVGQDNNLGNTGASIRMYANNSTYSVVQGVGSILNKFNEYIINRDQLIIASMLGGNYLASSSTYAAYTSLPVLQNKVLNEKYVILPLGTSYTETNSELFTTVSTRYTLPVETKSLNALDTNTAGVYVLNYFYQQSPTVIYYGRKYIVVE